MVEATPQRLQQVFGGTRVEVHHDSTETGRCRPGRLVLLLDQVQSLWDHFHRRYGR